MTAKTHHIMRIVTIIGLLAALALLGGCSAGKPASSSDASAAPAETPTLKLTVPEDGAKVPAGTVSVAVETTGLEFVMPSNKNVAGQGHVHFSIDGGPIVMSVEPKTELKDVEPGKHKLVAELVQNNTESFDPPIEQEIEFIAE